MLRMLQDEFKFLADRDCYLTFLMMRNSLTALPGRWGLAICGSAGQVAEDLSRNILGFASK
jgi:hypothetical protein